MSATNDLKYFLRGEPQLSLAGTVSSGDLAYFLRGEPLRTITTTATGVDAGGVFILKVARGLQVDTFSPTEKIVMVVGRRRMGGR